MLDPHMGGVLERSIGAMASAPFRTMPAKGEAAVVIKVHRSSTSHTVTSTARNRSTRVGSAVSAVMSTTMSVPCPVTEFTGSLSLLPLPLVVPARSFFWPFRRQRSRACGGGEAGEGSDC